VSFGPVALHRANVSCNRLPVGDGVELSAAAGTGVPRESASERKDDGLKRLRVSERLTPPPARKPTCVQAGNRSSSFLTRSRSRFRTIAI